MVYVDNMNAHFGDMIMCHMVADSNDELLAMADRIGVKRRQAIAEHENKFKAFILFNN
jgi:hypothetical protein